MQNYSFIYTIKYSKSVYYKIIYLVIPPTIAPNAWNNKALIIVTQSAEFNGKVSIVPMKQAGAGTLDISKALIYDGFGKILDVTTTGY